MTRSLVLRSLTVALVLAGIGCDERRHATRRSRARGAQPTILAESAPAPARTAASAPAGAAIARPTPPTPPPPAAGVAVAGPVAAAAKSMPAPAGAVPAAASSPPGAAGATDPRMAVVILMLPGAGDPAHPGKGAPLTSGGAPLTYRLSLAPGAESATIELDGRPPVKAPVQRVYPSPAPPVSPSSLALLRSVPAAPTARTPPGPATAATGAAPPSAPASRMNRRVFPTATRPPLAADQVEYTSANGAPIIE